MTAEYLKYLIQQEYKKLQKPKQPPTQPAPGVIFLLHYEIEENYCDLMVNFLVVNRHPDQPELLFLIPCDQEIFWTARPDVITSNGFVARTAHGLWIDQKNIDPDCAIDQIDQIDLKRIRRTLSQLVNGTLAGHAPMDEDSFYWEYAATVQEITNQITKNQQA